MREEIVVLAQKYIIEGILPANKIEDAMHSACYRNGFRDGCVD
ncbi:MAG: hypothetical protein QME41_09815 [Actinomycetota bacterium]|nr:hypothetical protein [Actinomycetota bacterium]